MTEENLKKFDKMAGISGKSVASQSSNITTDKQFGPQLLRNKIIHTNHEAQAPNDLVELRGLLDHDRKSPPPDEQLYRAYLSSTEDIDVELGVEFTAYPKLRKDRLEWECEHYKPRLNHSWSAINNHISVGLSDAKPDMVESYRKMDYPDRAIEALGGDLGPSSFDEAMPAYAVEFKSLGGNFQDAKLQCAYDGALMAEGSRALHAYIGSDEKDLLAKTQALTLAFNGEYL